MKALFFSITVLLTASCAPDETVTVGSKRFTESYVLCEMGARVVEEAGYEVAQKQGLGGTVIVWEALKRGDLDIYPEYTGTIREAILKIPTSVSDDSLRNLLATYGVGASPRLGFNNTYAFVMPETLADSLDIRTISDLKMHRGIRAGFTHEFLKRGDGWPALSNHYGFELEEVNGLEHALAYEAIRSASIDLMDAYSTDAKLLQYNLRMLEDDLQFFPQYDALFLYRLDLPEVVKNSLDQLSGTIDESQMILLNATAEETGDYAIAAGQYWGDTDVAPNSSSFPMYQIMIWTAEHMRLVAISLLLAVLVGIPLGIKASRGGTVGQIILGTTGVVQTIPSLALLALFAATPALGIGVASAIIALFLYSLLPIVRNTASGLQNIDAGTRDSAVALGLGTLASLFKVYLPIASRTILAGIKTSAIINVGTATLAALIGAGGLGDPIISGLSLNDSGTIMSGAIPAALLALLVQSVFELMDRFLIPRGLRIQAEQNMS